jgi:hypothetical protein
MAIVAVGVLIIGFFIIILVYESKKDISQEKTYASFLNKPYKI